MENIMGLQYMEFVPNEKATPIRYPSTANLMVDSADRVAANYPLCNDFLITKKQSLMNGFFTRVGTTEVVLEWATPNVSDIAGTLDYTVGTIVNSFILSGYFTVEELVDAIVDNCNDYTTATGVTWTAVPIYGAGVKFNLAGPGVANGVVWGLEGPIIAKLNNGIDVISEEFAAGGSSATIFASGVDLRPARYLDIVCTQLTNNQAVKDASTAPNTRDVLCRWYFDYDNQNPTDTYGFPILMGYTPFYIRRIFNPPKQIQWQSNVPIGQMAFQLYDDQGKLASVNSKTNFLMTLQASEV